MQPPTEEMILEIIRKHRLITAEEISRILFMTKPNIQYHLKKMVQKRMLEVSKGITGENQKPGRPELFYRLNEKMVGNNLAQLCDLLLDQEDDQGRLLTVIRDLAKKMLPAPSLYDPVVRKLKSLVDELNQRAYTCRWEAHKSGPLIVFGNCPYASIIDKHTAICNMDIALLEDYLQYPVKQIARINPITRLPTECQFTVSI